MSVNWLCYRQYPNSSFCFILADNNSSMNIEGYNTSVLQDNNKVDDCNNTLKSLRRR